MRDGGERRRGGWGWLAVKGRRQTLPEPRLLPKYRAGTVGVIVCVHGEADVKVARTVRPAVELRRARRRVRAAVPGYDLLLRNALGRVARDAGGRAGPRLGDDRAVLGGDRHSSARCKSLHPRSGIAGRKQPRVHSFNDDRRCPQFRIANIDTNRENSKREDSRNALHVGC